MNELETKDWICDTCGERIERVEDGWVQWLNTLTPDGIRSEDLQLVHHGVPGKKCLFNEERHFRAEKATVADSELESFVGGDGLMRFLEFIADGRFQDPNEPIEMIKRLFIPGYEQARRHLKRAASEGVFEPNTREGFPHVSDIRMVLKWLEEEKEEG